MPIYEYKARTPAQSCDFCRDAFEIIRKLSDPPLVNCPKCAAPVIKLVSPAAVGQSRTGLDDRAKAAGFQKLKKIGKGEYEKMY